VTEQRLRVSVDRDVCQGTAMCTSIAGQYFRLREGYSEPVSEEVDEHQDVIDAAENCPVEAILVTAVEDGRVVAPEPY